MDRPENMVYQVNMHRTGCGNTQALCGNHQQLTVVLGMLLSVISEIVLNI